MAVIDAESGFEFAYKGFQYPIPPAFKLMIRQQDQIEWLLQALLMVNEGGATGKQLESMFADFEKRFEESVPDQVREYLENVLPAAVKNEVDRQVNAVYFGLNEQGRFVAYIPESWSQIRFDTGANYELETYGRLMLRYDVDSPETVNQTPEKVRD